MLGGGRARAVVGACTGTQQKARITMACEGCASREVPVVIWWLNVDVINNVRGSGVWVWW